MSESKHTPGPWTVHMAHLDCLWVGSGSARIADINQQGTHQEDDANACLIAAAPEMLAALRWIAEAEKYPGEVLSPLEQCVKRARAAIAKANGETRSE